jgi:hypothetical protein
MDNLGSDLKSKPSIDYAPQTCAKLHPSWVAFVRFCRELGYGEIENLRIQDGIPLSAETIRKKIRFPSKTGKEFEIRG